MNRTEKEQAVEELRAELPSAASILITDLSGIDVETLNGLRSAFRQRGVNYKVAKNTLIKIAVKDTDAEAMSPLLVGPTALAWHNEEPSIPAKVLKDFVKENPKFGEAFKIKGGYIDGDAINGPDAVKVLADLPSKDELRARLLGTIKMVPGKFLALLETPPRKFLAVLKAYEEKQKEEAGQ